MKWFKKKKLYLQDFCWRCITDTVLEKEYFKYCRLLDEAGLDYRVWMDENDPVVVFRREIAADPAEFPRNYIFYVKRSDYRKACRALHIDPAYLYRRAIS